MVATGRSKGASAHGCLDQGPAAENPKSFFDDAVVQQVSATASLGTAAPNMDPEMRSSRRIATDVQPLAVHSLLFFAPLRLAAARVRLRPAGSARPRAAGGERYRSLD